MTHQYQSHEQCVIAEKAQLSDRLTRLHAFMSGDQFRSLPEEDRDLLRKQFNATGELILILGKRIDRAVAMNMPIGSK